MPKIKVHLGENNHYFTQKGNHDIQFEIGNPSTLIMKDQNGKVFTYRQVKESYNE